MDWLSLSQPLMTKAIMAMIMLLLSFGLYCIRAFTNTAKQKTKNESIQGALTILDNIVETVVGFINQTIVNEFKKSNPSLSKVQAELASKTAIDQVQKLLPTGISSILNGITDDLTDLISKKIEDAVDKRKSIEKIPIVVEGILDEKDLPEMYSGTPQDYAEDEDDLIDPIIPVSRPAPSLRVYNKTQ